MNLAIILAVLRNRKISLIESNKFICSSLYEILKDNQNKILGHHSTSSGTAFIWIKNHIRRNHRHHSGKARCKFLLWKLQNKNNKNLTHKGKRMQDHQRESTITFFQTTGLTKLACNDHKLSFLLQANIWKITLQTLAAPCKTMVTSDTWVWSFKANLH